MASSDPETPERSAEHWRRLAQQALIEAEIAMDPEVQDVLRAIAQDYMMLAQQAEAKASLPGEAQPQPQARS